STSASVRSAAHSWGTACRSATASTRTTCRSWRRSRTCPIHSRASTTPRARTPRRPARSMRKRLLISGAAAAGAAAALLLGGLLRGGSPGDVRVTADAAAASIQGGFAAGNTQALVAQLQGELRAHPNAKGFGLLGL